MKKRLIEFTCLALFVVLALAPASHATNLSFNATADNEFYMYLSTNPTTAGTQIGYGNDWPTTYSGSGALTPGVINYLHVYGINWGGPASFIGDFTLSDANFYFANATQSLVTNTTDWFVSSASDWTTGPNIATSWGVNGVGPWGFHPSIDATAQWIWTTAYEGGSAYITTVISPVATPVPGAALLFGSGLIGLLGLRRKLAI